ncbi:hypothetical protein BT96DRAFT_943564 [Gymnopus androsaceus JB14]|uniref:OPT superfamily oligopeptide transporter n=1 Tax=Gymnopus androsaceus JB14 TaxID=1447944 RepID=A0A6A4H6R4_9AGAR|nr:hypothetical protein BT96DRAFT_943564 [Gymnopus androsaceus JB14]
MLFLGLGFSAFGSVLAQLYYFKPQTLLVSENFLLIVIYFIGKAWEKGLPSRGIFCFINPGPFNIKEHGAALIMAFTASSSATAIQVISVQDLYYLLATPLRVFCKRRLFTRRSASGISLFPNAVPPATVITPASIFQVLHFDSGLGSKRTKIFWALFTFIFCYKIFPQWILPILTGVSIFCLVDHTSPTMRNIFGGASNNKGKGLLAACFDWNIITSINLYTPLWTQLNQDISVVLTYSGSPKVFLTGVSPNWSQKMQNVTVTFGDPEYILMCAVYYGNIWQGLKFPFMSQAIFNINGNQYNQTAILTNNKFDPVKYAEVGITFRMLFLGLGFSAFGSVLAQLYYFKPQTLLVSENFLLIVIYFIGKAWEKGLPSCGAWCCPDYGFHCQ